VGLFLRLSGQTKHRRGCRKRCGLDSAVLMRRMSTAGRKRVEKVRERRRSDTSNHGVRGSRAVGHGRDLGVKYAQRVLAPSWGCRGEFTAPGPCRCRTLLFAALCRAASVLPRRTVGALHSSTSPSLARHTHTQCRFHVETRTHVPDENSFMSVRLERTCRLPSPS